MALVDRMDLTVAAKMPYALAAHPSGEACQASLGEVTS